MNDLFAFEQPLWERALDGLQPGDSVSAVQLLTLLEGEDEYALEDALQMLEDGGAALDITTLPKAPGTGEAALRLRQEEQLANTGDLLFGLGDTDPLRLYLEELAQIPACGDVAVLAANAAAGSENARNMLVNLMLSRVVELAKEYVGYGVLLMDLIQEGGMGMWQGILNWNGDGDFEDHADWWIRQYMAKAVLLQARSAGVGQKMRQALEDYRSVDEKLLVDLGRNPTVAEIAVELHINGAQADTLRQMLENARILQQAKAVPEQEDAPEEAEAHVEDTAYFQMRQRIADLLAELEPADAKLLTLRYGLEGGLPLSPEDAGKRLGLTPNEVLAREAAALMKLRNAE